MKSQHQTVVLAMQSLRGHRADLLEACKRMFDGAAAKMYTTDFFAIGAAKRTVSLIDGFGSMVETWNLGCARALLRMQIDTALRFAAVTLVENQEDFVMAVLRNERIDRLKDRAGQKLTDAYLVQTFKAMAPWLPEVYSRTSGYIHLSGQHVYSSVQDLDDASRTISWGIGSIDDHFPESSWLEVVECFAAAVLLFAGSLESWLEAKTRHAV
jgi:hypothetical protein